MDSLDRAIELVTRWKADRQKQRAEVAARLETVAEECQAAIQVWQGYLKAPGAPGDHWTIVSWIGPDRARQLHEINLRAKWNVEDVCRVAGPGAGRFVALDNEDVIEMAYRQLKPGETGVEAAKTAVERLLARIDYLRGLIERVRTAKPASASAKAGAKKTGASKTAPKKAKKKTAASPAKKKAAAPKKK